MAIDIEYSSVLAHQQGNSFAVTLFGHSRSIPAPVVGTQRSNFDVVQYNESETFFNTLISELSSNTNFNRMYDSFYSPTDFRLRSLQICSMKSLPEDIQYDISLKVNGVVIDTLIIPGLKDHNQIAYAPPSCDLQILEDDLVEVEVLMSTTEGLIWNDHNITVSIGGCIVYDAYEDIDDTDFDMKERYYKTCLTLHNRSGYDTLKDRIILSKIKSPINFLVQSIRFSCIEDNLMKAEAKIIRSSTCFYVDVLMNGYSINRKLGIDQPVSLGVVNNALKSYNSGTYDNSTGLPIQMGDEISIKIYLNNYNTKHNAKLFECILIGCSVDCINEPIDIISVFERCETNTCQPKFAKTNDACNKTLTSDNPELTNITGTTTYNEDLNVDMDYVVSEGIYVLINGQYIFVRRPTK